MWAFAGDEYRQEMVQLTCRDLNEKEKELLLWLPKKESVELDGSDHSVAQDQQWNHQEALSQYRRRSSV